MLATHDGLVDFWTPGRYEDTGSYYADIFSQVMALVKASSLQHTRMAARQLSPRQNGSSLRPVQRSESIHGLYTKKKHKRRLHAAVLFFFFFHAPQRRKVSKDRTTVSSSIANPHAYPFGPAILGKEVSTFHTYCRRCIWNGKESRAAFRKGIRGRKGFVAYCLTQKRSCCEHTRTGLGSFCGYSFSTAPAGSVCTSEAKTRLQETKTPIQRCDALRSPHESDCGCQMDTLFWYISLSHKRATVLTHGVRNSTHLAAPFLEPSLSLQKLRLATWTTEKQSFNFRRTQRVNEHKKKKKKKKLPST